MKKLRRRYNFDIILSALLIAEMFFEVTGDFLHEVIGCAFFLTIVAHLVLSKKWMSVTARQLSSGKRMKLANKQRLVLAIGLAVSFVALMASSVIISLVLIDMTGVNLAGPARETWIVIHTVSSYALCGFTIAHVLVHWASICSVFKIPYNPARRQAINTGATAVFAVSAVALGAVGGKAIDDIVNPKLPQQQSSDIPTAEAAPAKQSPTEISSAPNSEPSGKKPPKGEKPAPSDVAPSGNSTTSPAPDTSQAPSAPNTNSGDGSSAAPTGYCTLCKLRCPLSAPQCNKPYQAGLI